MDNEFWLNLITAVAPIAVALIGIIPTINSRAKKTDNKIDLIEKKLDSHIEEDKEAEAKDSRHRIISFATAVRNGKEFDADAWNSINADCESYLAYCENHPNFPDGICKTTVKFLQDRLAALVNEGAFEK